MSFEFEFRVGVREWKGNVGRAVTPWPPHRSTNRHKFPQIDMCRYVQSRGESFFFFDRINKINRIGVGVVYIL